MKPARAKANLASLFTDADYPPDALRNHETGTTGFRLEVGVDGRVSSCTIASSSGSASLDGTTCRILRERARFTPAHDRRGRPRTDQVDGRITWWLDPADLPALEASLRAYTVRATAAGEVTCSMALNAEAAASADCLPDQRSQIAEMARASGRAQERTLVTITIPAGEREPVVVRNHGAQFFEMNVSLGIAPDGTVLECRVTRDEGRDPAVIALHGDACADYKRGARLFRPLSRPAASGPRSVTMKTRGYDGTVAAAASGASTDPETRARARANLASLFTDADYPADAMRRRESGTTGFRLRVGADGMVKNCSVTSSSGSASLDGATCRILTERARFTPARDGRGQPADDVVVGRITWRAGKEQMVPFGPGRAVLTITATPAGGVACTTEWNGVVLNEECGPDAALTVERAQMDDKVVEQSIVTIFTPEGEREPVDTANRGTLAATAEAVLEIRPDGSVGECRPARKQGGQMSNLEDHESDPCAVFAPGTRMFEPAPGTATPASRVVNVTIRFYHRLFSPGDAPVA